MSLFGFGKKKNAVEKPACQCGCSVIPPSDDTPLAQSCHGTQDGIAVKVLGTGCTACHTLLENTQAAVSHLGLDAQVEYVQDMAQIAGYGVMCVPALVINDQVVSTGKVLKSSEVADILKKSAHN